MSAKERFFDSVHGFIHLSEEEKQLLEHPAFIRLHYLHQLGIAYLVYPGATHSRFEHSLGVMHVASKIYDQIFETQNQIHRQALRLGALCHDLGHLPFSHTLEHELLSDHGHEKKTIEVLYLLKDTPIFKRYENLHPGFFNLVVKIAVSPSIYLKYFKNDSYLGDEKLLSSIVSGDYFGADRIDYLIRDSRFTGVSVGLFDYPQLIEMLTVCTINDQEMMALKEEGLEAVEGLLLARHYMHARVYCHRGVLACNQALKAFVKKISIPDFISLAAEDYIKYTDAWLIQQFIEASFDTKHPAHKEALVLMSRLQKSEKKQAIASKKMPGPLYLVKKTGQVETLYPKAWDASLFVNEPPIV